MSAQATTVPVTGQTTLNRKVSISTGEHIDDVIVRGFDLMDPGTLVAGPDIREQYGESNWDEDFTPDRPTYKGDCWACGNKVETTEPAEECESCECRAMEYVATG